MNFKIENIILNITNYPSVERHLEDMASKGWMLDKIVFGHIFIYKNSSNKELDFSIIPYENESFLNKVSREDLEKMKNKNEDLGWKYTAKVNNFQVYFKEKDKDAQKIIESEKIELRILESIAKTHKISVYVFLALILFLFFNFLKESIKNINFMKSGLSQMTIIMLPLMMTTHMIEIFSINKFLKRNRKNTSKSESIEYNNSKFYFNKFTFIFMYIYCLVFILYIIYTGLFSEGITTLVSLLPVTIGILVGSFFRFFIKPSKKLEDYKIFILIGVIVGTLIFVNIVVRPIITDSIEDEWKRVEDVDLGKDKALKIEDFISKDKNTNAKLSRDISFLIPKSYEYINREDLKYDFQYLRTEYSKALTENLAKIVVNRYKLDVEEQINQWTDYMLENYYYNSIYSDGLKSRGVSEDELSQMKNNDLATYKRQAKEKMKERSIVEINSKLWNVDEAYFLDYEKSIIILRKSKEVYTLYGMNFSDEEVRKIVMEKLGLN